MDKIYVDQFDIDKGVPANCGECPIALALAAHYNVPGHIVIVESYDSIYVGETRIVVHDDDKPIVEAFIEDFDCQEAEIPEDEWILYRKYTMKPISFRFTEGKGI